MAAVLVEGDVEEKGEQDITECLEIFISGFARNGLEWCLVSSKTCGDLLRGHQKIVRWRQVQSGVSGGGVTELGPKGEEGEKHTVNLDGKVIVGYKEV